MCRYFSWIHLHKKFVQKSWCFLTVKWKRKKIQGFFATNGSLSGFFCECSVWKRKKSCISKMEWYKLDIFCWIYVRRHIRFVCKTSKKTYQIKTSSAQCEISQKKLISCQCNLNFKDQQPLPNPFQNRNLNWRILHLKLEKNPPNTNNSFFSNTTTIFVSSYHQKSANWYYVIRWSLQLDQNFSHFVFFFSVLLLKENLQDDLWGRLNLEPRGKNTTHLQSQSMSDSLQNRGQ